VAFTFSYLALLLTFSVSLGISYYFYRDNPNDKNLDTVSALFCLWFLTAMVGIGRCFTGCSGP
jgi:hypothetical protein